jgi:protein-L-isoaspartate(D-aspartate) O-methyltransferase
VAATRVVGVERAQTALYRELRRRGIAGPVVDAMAEVPRELFAPPGLGEGAYVDAPLPLPAGQTISQPYVVGRMCELLDLHGDDRVLDVGTGSGWHAAVLARLSHHVWSIERYGMLARLARRNLAAAHIGNVTVIVGDGTRGHAAAAPYDAINVAAAARGRIPAALEDELADGGRLVAPVDGRLVLIRRDGGTLLSTDHDSVRFVPLIGDERD